jgi:hypothetical protein
MALQFAEIYAVHIGLVEKSVQGVLERCQHPVLDRLRTSGWRVTRPHTIYGLSTKDVVEGKGLSAAMMMGIRFSLLAGGQPVAAAELPVRDGKPATARASVHIGPICDSLLKIEELAGGENQARSLEVRYLRMPALHSYGIWLHSANPLEDTIHTTMPTVTKFQGRTFQEAEFLEILRDIATVRAKKFKDLRRKSLGADEAPGGTRATTGPMES